MDLAVTRRGRRVLSRGMTPPFEQTYDVIVVGLGTAGAEAYVRAVELGLRTLGVEKHNGMGGIATLGCVDFIGSITQRQFDLERRGAAGEVRYEAVADGVWLDGVRVTGVRVLSNGVRRSYGAKVVIDATGNGTVARMAGVRLRRGRAFDGVKAPCARGESWMRPDGKIYPIYRNYPDDLTRSGEAYSATVTMLACERHRFWLQHKSKERLVKPALLVGAREECRVETETVVSLMETLAGRTFPDPIFYAFEPEDLPVFYGDYAFESEAIQNWKVLCGLPLFAYPAILPYGTIVAKGVDGLLVPSKHFGVAHDLGGGIRMQEAMRRSGAAAAAAASIVCARGCRTADVPYAALKPLLDKMGTLRPPRQTSVTSVHGYVFKPFSDDEVMAALDRDATITKEWWYAKAEGGPDERTVFAYWTAWYRAMSAPAAARRALADRLADRVEKGGRHAGNYAVALGLMRDRRAVPLLRTLVSAPGGACDPVVMNAYPNRFKALLLLGRFKDVASVPVLMALVQDEARAFTADLLRTKAFKTPDTYRFQALSYALMALKAILKDHPDPACSARLNAWLARPRVLKAFDGANLAERFRPFRFDV